MADAAAGAPAGLIKALQSLRKLLASGTREQMPVSIRFMAHGAKGPNGEPIDMGKYPRTLAVKRAVEVARKEGLAALTRRTVPRVRATKILNFLTDTIGIDLDELPAPPEILRALEALIVDMKGKAPSGAAGRKRKRASDKPQKPRELTIIETETIQIVGECKGNVAMAAPVREGPKDGCGSLSQRAGQSGEGSLLAEQKDQGPAVDS